MNKRGQYGIWQGRGRPQPCKGPFVPRNPLIDQERLEQASIESTTEIGIRNGRGPKCHGRASTLVSPLRIS
jgi:hypothetical protein